jgi:hypothetical protein
LEERKDPFLSNLLKSGGVIGSRRAWPSQPRKRMKLWQGKETWKVILILLSCSLISQCKYSEFIC